MRANYPKDKRGGGRKPNPNHMYPMYRTQMQAPPNNPPVHNRKFRKAPPKPRHAQMRHSPLPQKKNINIPPLHRSKSKFATLTIILIVIAIIIIVNAR